MARNSSINGDFRNLADGFSLQAGVLARKFELAGSDVKLVGQQASVFTLPNEATDTLFGYKILAAKGDIISASAAGTPEILSVGSDGQFIIADSAEASGMRWTSIDSMSYAPVTGTTHTAVPNTSMCVNNAALCTITMPATCAAGALFEVAGVGSGGWKVQLGAGQTIVHGNVSSTVAGSIESTHARDVVQFRCVIADTEFQVLDNQGNLELL